MKYKDYVQQLEKLPHRDSSGRTLAEMYGDSVEIWSNYAAIGYAKIAMEQAGIDSDSINKVVAAMNKAFDDYSIDEAEKHYY